MFELKLLPVSVITEFEVKLQAKVSFKQVIDFIQTHQCNDWQGITTNPKPETSVRIFVIPNDKWNELLEAIK